MRHSVRFPRLRRNRFHLHISLSLILLLLVFFLIFHISHLNILKFLLDFSQSLFKVSLSYVLALLLAFVLASITLKSRRLESIFLPVLDVLQSFPSFALLPLLVAYRHSLVSLVIVLVSEMLWPILFGLIGTYKNIRQDLADAATIFGAVGPRRLWHFTLPALLPGLVTGSIVAWGEAWETIIGAEIILASPGLGVFFSRIGDLEPSLTLVAITGLMLILYIVNKLIWLPMLEKVTAYQTE